MEGDDDITWITISVETLKALNKLRKPKESYEDVILYLIELYQTEKMLYERLGGVKFD